MTTMNAIPTEFNGITYRSRVEARWAVFFDRMGWPAVYEQEGFDLGGVRYLPDFWLPEWKVFVEIKSGDPEPDEIKKCEALSAASQKPVWLFAGSPGNGTYKVFLFGMKEPEPRYEGWVDEAEIEPAIVGFEDSSVARTILSCRRCPRACLYYERLDDSRNMHEWGWREIGERCTNGDCSDRMPVYSGRVQMAADAAKNERFGVHDEKRVNERMSFEEICSLFRSSVPIEALNLFHRPPSYMSAKMIRDRILELSDEAARR